MYSALDVARYIINRYGDGGVYISNLKLQKILYFVQANFLVETNGNKCFYEKIEAWSFSPVVPVVYRKYKIYGSAAIPMDLYNDGIDFIAPDDAGLIDEILETCKNYSASDLVNITHHQSPWIDAFNRGRNTEITAESLIDFFKEN